RVASAVGLPRLARGRLRGRRRGRLLAEHSLLGSRVPGRDRQAQHVGKSPGVYPSDLRTQLDHLWGEDGPCAHHPPEGSDVRLRARTVPGDDEPIDVAAGEAYPHPRTELRRVVEAFGDPVIEAPVQVRERGVD